MQVGIIFLAIGSVLSFTVVFFCIRSWCRRQPEWFRIETPIKRSRTNDSMDAMDGSYGGGEVQLLQFIHIHRNITS